MATWSGDANVISGLSADSNDSAAVCTFLDGSTLKLIMGHDMPTTGWKGYYWSGSAWVLDASVINGLGTPGAGRYRKLTIFNDSGTFKLIAGENDGAFYGWYWNGSSWVSDGTIVNGLADVGSESAPTVWDDSGTWKLITGEINGTFIGYYWNGSAWVADSSIVTGLTKVGVTGWSVPTVWNDGTLKLIAGADDASLTGWYWNGSTWVADSSIVSGLGGPTTYSIPHVFDNGGYWRCILGQFVDGLLYGFTGPVSLVALDGTVTDEWGNKLRDVSVKLENGTTYSLTTDENGEYSQNVSPDTYTFTVSKSPFITHTEDIIISGAATEDFILKFRKETGMRSVKRWSVGASIIGGVSCGARKR